MIKRLIEIAVYVYNITITNPHEVGVRQKGVSMKIEVNQIKTNKKNIEVHIIPTEDMRYEEI